jgi:hypothetical protein
LEDLGKGKWRERAKIVLGKTGWNCEKGGKWESPYDNSSTREFISLFKLLKTVSEEKVSNLITLLSWFDRRFMKFIFTSENGCKVMLHLRNRWKMIFPPKLHFFRLASDIWELSDHPLYFFYALLTSDCHCGPMRGGGEGGCLTSTLTLAKSLFSMNQLRHLRSANHAILGLGRRVLDEVSGNRRVESAKSDSCRNREDLEQWLSRPISSDEMANRWNWKKKKKNWVELWGGYSGLWGFVAASFFASKVKSWRLG